MGIIFRQSLKGSLVIYLATIIGSINRVYLMPKFLKPEEIGFIDNMTYIAILIASFSSIGLIGAITKFHQEAKNKKIFNNLISFVLIRILVLFFSSTLILYFLSGYIPSNLLSKFAILKGNNAIIILIFSIIILIRNFQKSISISEKRITVPIILDSFLGKITTFILTILIGVELINFNNYLILFIVFHLTSIILLAIYLSKVFEYKIRLTYQIEKKFKKKVYTFSIYAIFGSIAGQFATYADSLMISSYDGLGMSGIYSIAFFIGTTIELPKRAISSVSTPIVISYFEYNQINEIEKLYKQTSINQGIISILFFIIIYVNLNNIFTLLPNGHIYIIAKNVIIYIGIAKVIDLIMGINAEIIIASKFYFYNLYITISYFLLIIFLNTIFIPKYGVVGASIATLISITTYNLARFLLIYYKLKIIPFSSKTLVLLVIFISILSLNLIFPINPRHSSLFLLIAHISIKSLIFGGLFIIICFYLNVSKEFNSLLKNLIYQIKHYFEIK